MKKWITLKSVETYKEGYTYYVPLNQNSNYIFKLWDKHNLKMLDVQQINETKWFILLKGSKKDFDSFIYEFITELNKLYNISYGKDYF